MKALLASVDRVSEQPCKEAQQQGKPRPVAATIRAFSLRYSDVSNVVILLDKAIKQAITTPTVYWK